MRHSAATAGVVVTNLDEFREFLKQDLEQCRIQCKTSKYSLGAGDLVAERVDLTGTQSGPMGPFPPSGKNFELPFLGILRVENGKVAEIWMEWDYTDKDCHYYI